MVPSVSRLKALAVSKKKKAGYYPDGAILYLQVSISGSKSWILRFMLNGRAREMGLGSVLAIPLEDARKRAAAWPTHARPPSTSAPQPRSAPTGPAGRCSAHSPVPRA